MITVIHTDHERLAGVSNLWFKRYPAQWRRMHAIANLLDVPLLALIYQRLREIEFGASREAFTRQEDFSVVTWEWRDRVVASRTMTQTATELVPIVRPNSLELRVVETGPHATVESACRK